MLWGYLQCLVREVKERNSIKYSLLFLVCRSVLSDKIWWMQKEALCSARLLVVRKLCIIKTLWHVIFFKSIVCARNFEETVQI